MIAADCLACVNVFLVSRARYLPNLIYALLVERESMMAHAQDPILATGIGVIHKVCAALHLTRDAVDA